VLVFQDGVGADLFGFGKVERIEAWVPVFLFSVLFGLSMDYQVFLLSRIQERYHQTGNTADGIVHGVASTARLITGAALIIIVVFAGFATGQLVSFQQMGFGVAVALLLDATIVRLVIIPAVMGMLGDRNWYLPRWLAWLPKVHVEGPPAAPRPRSASPHHHPCRSPEVSSAPGRPPEVPAIYRTAAGRWRAVRLSSTALVATMILLKDMRSAPTGAGARGRATGRGHGGRWGCRGCRADLSA
jgi:hypothetical protein